MLKRILNREHLKQLQSGFFAPPKWLEKAIPQYSIRKLISVTILVVLSFFLVMIAISIAENQLVSRYQKMISEKALPLMLVSSDLQENLSELIVLTEDSEKATSSQSIASNRSISNVVDDTKNNLSRLKEVVDDRDGIKSVRLQLSGGFQDIESTLYDQSLSKLKLLQTEAHFSEFQDKTNQLFINISLLEEALSGKMALMSVRQQRLNEDNKSRGQIIADLHRNTTGISLSISKLGRFLTKFNVLTEQDALLNFRENQLKQNLVSVLRQLRQFVLLPKPAGQQENLNEIAGDLRGKVESLRHLLLTTDDSLFSFAQQRMEQRKIIEASSSRLRGLISQMGRRLKSVAVLSETRAQEMVDKAQIISSVGGWAIFLVGTILVCVLALFLGGIMRRINQPIDKLSNAMHSLSMGDVSARLLDDDAVSEEFNRLWHDFNQFSERTERLVNEQKMIFDNAEIGIAWIRNRQYLKVNAKLLEVFNTDEDYFIGEKTRKIYCSEEDYLKVGEGYSALEQGETFSTEVQMKRPDGSTFWSKVSGKSTGLGLEKDSVWLYEDITKRKLAEEKLYKLANFDDLTGLPNRSFFGSMLDQAIQRAKRNGTEFALIFIDLDRFKHINDSLGHDVGDRVLCEISRRIENIIRASDVVARLGGDEFTVIIDSFGATTDLVNVAEKINRELSKGMTFEQRELFVGGSIGISVYPKDGEQPGELLSRADAAMYAAKELGRNNAQFYNKQIGLCSEKFIELSSSLRLALENDEFELYYQPKVELKKRQIIGMEALIRWNRPGFGLVPPIEFIPVLEESGLMSEVGSWVIEEAGRTYQKWIKQGLKPGSIAVNLSERQFNNDQLLNSLSAVLEDTGIPAPALELEITESLMMGDTHNATKVLKEIKSRGFEVAMDDFGTGYSSLAYLKRFPIDTIKIDRTFVRDITTDEDDAAIIDAILAIARQLKLKSVAEGIETEEQLSLLLNKACEIGQGYLFSEPVSTDKMTKLLEKGVL